MPELIELSAPYLESFVQGIRVFQQNAEMQSYDIAWITRNFPRFLQRLEDRKDAAKIAADLVPATEYWLYEGQVLLGHSQFRHRLNENLIRFGGHIGYRIRPDQRGRGYGKLILRLCLAKARAYGLTSALLTCDETNLASRSVIEANGGQLENTILLPEREVATRRYWIDISTLELPGSRSAQEQIDG